MEAHHHRRTVHWVDLASFLVLVVVLLLLSMLISPAA